MDSHRYCVIMCGGVGSRFWPCSRSEMPKQFLDFFGTGRSLLQMTVDRILPLVSHDRILLVTNKAYTDIIRRQLPEIPESNILPEPARRNTAPCIYWATRHILALDSEAAIVTLPADHLVLREEEFRNVISRGFKFVEEGDRLLTIGLKPTTPHTGYGYIQQGAPVDGWPGFLKVKSFTEKPNEEMAKIFLQTGEFFWNSGMFLWTGKSIVKAFGEYSPEIAAAFDAIPAAAYATSEEMKFIDEAFPNAPGISIDYAIMEKASNVYVETADIGWSDLGSWKALYDVSPKNAEGNVTQNCKAILHDCSDSVFAIEGDRIVVASGLKDYIVAESENALLIYPKSEEQKIRQVVNYVKTRFGEKYI